MREFSGKMAQTKISFPISLELQGYESNMRLSIIIPTFNEAKTIRALAGSLRVCECVLEILVADGGSQDATVDLALSHGWQVIATARGRGVQMNAVA